MPQSLNIAEAKAKLSALADRAHHPTLDHTVAAGQLPGPHRDPWGRPIMAQAIRDGFTVVTLDPVFRDYGVPVCW